MVSIADILQQHNVSITVCKRRVYPSGLVDKVISPRVHSWFPIVLSEVRAVHRTLMPFTLTVPSMGSSTADSAAWQTVSGTDHLVLDVSARYVVTQAEGHPAAFRKHIQFPRLSQWCDARNFGIPKSSSSAGRLRQVAA